mmetsp:Transcript_8885/g.10904  ORF Transcript_8885/g.10904 Transcript_8885/m.10904 type:complete len:186 (+) Transcript_8885:2389-2946(+)
MCTACSDLYWKNLGNFECYPCAMAGTSRTTVYIFKVISFYAFCYTLGRLFLGGFSKPNSESLASVKILLTFGQTLFIISKMEQTRTKNLTEASMTSFLDTLIFYLNPGEWIFDFDCLFMSLEPEQKYLNRLLLTIFMPMILLIANIVTIWFLTFMVKQCQFRKREDMRPLNCTRLFNRVSIAFGI